MTATKLKPCPFCGAPAAQSPYGYWIACIRLSCGAMSQAAETRKEMSRRWNRRFKKGSR